VCEDGPTQPTLDAGLAWLRAHAFVPRRVTLCWGDARMPNLMFRDDHVVAVLDWEMAFLGDPEADLGWWCFLDWANNEGYGAPHLAGIPRRDETVARYGELTGHPVEHARWHEAFAAFRYGVIMARVATRLRAIGATVPSEDFETNNVCTQALARLLELPPPGEHRLSTTLGSRDAGAPVRLQFRLSGEGGGDWYVVVEDGRGRRHDGVVDDPDATLVAAAADWRAVQSGKLDRLKAYLDGTIRIDGDLTLFMLHEAVIAALAGTR
jgi:putative sterol carrier protein